MPFPYYNTASPTSSSKNTINSVTVDYGIRDFLLNKNLLPVYPFISTTVNGSPKIGEPVLDTMVGTGNVIQPFGLPLETEGILRMEIAVLPNKFKNSSSTAGELLSINNINSIELFPNSSFPNGIQSYPTGPSESTFKYGIMGKTIEGEFRKKATLRNLYLDVDKQVDSADWITLETAPTSQQIKGYLDVYGGLNLGGSAGIQAANVIGSVLNGQGLGLAKGGVVTNYDLRSSLAGRVLGATGLINDTKLGMIGGQQLALALANNAAFNLEQSALGALNVQDNVLSLVKNGTLAGFRPNYQITVASSTGGKILDYTSRILGFTLPKSLLDDAGSIFQSENGNAENIARANAMILHTGKGQVVSLLTNVRANLAVNSTTSPFRTGYAPGFTNNKGEQEITDGILYAFGNGEGHIINPLNASDGVIPDLSYQRDGKVSDSGFKDLTSEYLEGYAENNIKTPTFSWGTSKDGNVNTLNEYRPFVGDRKSLLSKTQKLFNSKGMMSIISSKGDMNINVPSQIQTAVVGNGISKGNAVLKATSFNEDGIVSASFKTAEETYCRSWTTFDRYDQVQKLVRSSGLNSTVPYRNQMVGSVLDEYGFPQIAPYSTDKPTDPKKYMFSIENLAWSDRVSDLLPCEVGPGDLISGKQGRIMWFPPYNIQFTENTSVDWENNKFVGRGESVYTYNNTERSGTLSFQIIVDHPSYINSFRGANGPDDHYVASFFAGCIDPSSKFADKLTVSEISSISTDNVTKVQEKVITPQVPPVDFSIYFPNDVATLDGAGNYEDGKCASTPIDYSTYVSGCSIGTFPGSFTSSGPWNDNYNFGLNGQSTGISVDGVVFDGYLDAGLIPALNTYLNEKCPACVVEVAGYASAQGNAAVNAKLANARRDYILGILKPQLHTNFKGAELDKRFKPMPSKELTGTGCNAKVGSDVDTMPCKLDRKVVVHFRFDASLLPKEQTEPDKVVTQVKRNVNSKITNRFYTECNYFDQLTDVDSFVFDKFRDKIKYFHPAFHSTTPEGLNSRLTFLQQCTRQGPTLEGQGANNLAFGRPPVCILRIGDFYNTKIIMDNIGIDFEPLVWDLNPEGIGVQPMIANVSISFKFIGGSTLMGPINKLQNALSFNYYANTQVYDSRADYIAKTSDIAKSLEGAENGLSKQQATKSIDGKYALINGTKDANKSIETVVTQGDIINDTPKLDQTAANEVATSGAGTQTGPEVAQDDISRINLYRVDNINNGIEVFFEIQGSTPLTKEYDFRLTLTDNDKITREVGIGKLATTGAQSFTYTGVVSGLVDEKSYFIIAKIGVENKTGLLTYIE